ncbi:hypothetical protein [Candidatus Minimicrobia naudis]
MQHYIDDGLTGEELFILYDTFGFPVELSTEEAYKQGIKLSDNWRAEDLMLRWMSCVNVLRQLARGNLAAAWKVMTLFI